MSVEFYTLKHVRNGAERPTNALFSGVKPFTIGSGSSSMFKVKNSHEVKESHAVLYRTQNGTLAIKNSSDDALVMVNNVTVKGEHPLQLNDIISFGPKLQLKLALKDKPNAAPSSDIIPSDGSTPKSRDFARSGASSPAPSRPHSVQVANLSSENNGDMWSSKHDLRPRSPTKTFPARPELSSTQSHEEISIPPSAGSRPSSPVKRQVSAELPKPDQSAFETIASRALRSAKSPPGSPSKRVVTTPPMSPSKHWSTQQASPPVPTPGSPRCSPRKEQRLPSEVNEAMNIDLPQSACQHIREEPSSPRMSARVGEEAPLIAPASPRRSPRKDRHPIADLPASMNVDLPELPPVVAERFAPASPRRSPRKEQKKQHQQLSSFEFDLHDALNCSGLDGQQTPTHTSFVVEQTFDEEAALFSNGDDKSKDELILGSSQETGPSLSSDALQAGYSSAVGESNGEEGTRPSGSESEGQVKKARGRPKLPPAPPKRYPSRQMGSSPEKKLFKMKQFEELNLEHLPVQLRVGFNHRWLADPSQKRSVKPPASRESYVCTSPEYRKQTSRQITSPATTAATTAKSPPPETQKTVSRTGKRKSLGVSTNSASEDTDEVKSPPAKRRKVTEETPDDLMWAVFKAGFAALNKDRPVLAQELYGVITSKMADSVWQFERDGRLIKHADGGYTICDADR